MEHLLIFILLALAIERFTDLTTTLDLLEGCRSRFARRFPRFGKLAGCKFCQSFWASLVVGWTCPYPLLSSLFSAPLAALVFKSVVLWLSLFGMALLLDEFLDRYLNRAPLSIFLSQQEYPMDDEDSGP